MKISIEPIGYLTSCYKEKFAVPRQPGLVPSGKAQIHLTPPYNHPDIVEGLETCSHIWLQFIFHLCLDAGWQHKVRPPRLGGNKKMGVLATRATHRPNSLGLSVVKLERIEAHKKDVVLHVCGIDLVEGTPIVDIKPYIPYSDSLPHAHYPFAQHVPNNIEVRFSKTAEDDLMDIPASQRSIFKRLAIEVLQQDPKPAFHNPSPERIYGVKLEGFELQWRYIESTIEVVSIKPQ